MEMQRNEGRPATPCVASIYPGGLPALEKGILEFVPK